MELKIIWIAWLLSAKTAMLEGGSGPSPILANFEPNLTCALTLVVVLVIVVVEIVVVVVVVELI